MSEPRIRGVTVRALDLPLAAPARTAAGVLSSMPVVLIDILDEAGVTGRSYLRTYTPLALAGLARLLDDLGGDLAGRGGSAPELGARLRAQFRLLGDRGLVGMALAGLDMALWDLDAKRAGVPLSRLLGAVTTSVPAYRPLAAVAPGPACAEAERALAEGFSAIKVKLGHAGLEADVEVVAALRAAVGDGVELMVDYNQSLSPEEALTRGRALEPYGLAWIEEPVDARDPLGHAHLAARLATPVAAGENIESLSELELNLRSRAVDVLTLDAMRIGGVSGWRHAATHAAGRGVPVCSHAFPEFSVHLIAASPTGRWLEFHDHLAPILARPLAAAAGRVAVPTEPGAGIAWDEQAVRRLL
ncbi:MAG TPA: enolase C-terminal domain-like protein [Solirubrobacteraceae bacterium]|nr:enolase C-terminal domain-like protein [Solirubrobacteraceae bacterium]